MLSLSDRGYSGSRNPPVAKPHEYREHHRRQESCAGLCVSALMVLLLIASAGCLNTYQKAMSNTPSGTDSGQGGTGAPVSSPDPANPQPPASPQDGISAKITPKKTNITEDVMPVLTPDTYPILHGTRINETPRFDFRYRIPDFNKTYALRANATGLLVNVVEGPLYIVYVVTPQYDCLAKPETCRGTANVSVTRPFMKITVRDNQTQEIVAEDGYGREFSSDIGSYEIIVDDAQNIDGKKVTVTSMPGPRSIAIYREGVFHITIEGNNLDADISIITGASPDPLDAVMQARQGKYIPSVTPTPIEEAWE